VRVNESRGTDDGHRDVAKWDLRGGQRLVDALPDDAKDMIGAASSDHASGGRELDACRVDNARADPVWSHVDAEHGGSAAVESYA
jgi:hypothetical protein